MRRLLLAVDGSEHAMNAARHVAELAASMPLRVEIVNVQPAVSGDVSMFIPRADLDRYHREQGEQQLARARALLAERGVEHDTHVLVGTPGESVARFAEEHRLDGIVMGTRGLGSLAGALLGSVAFKVVHLAAVPVTLVK